RPARRADRLASAAAQRHHPRTRKPNAAAEPTDPIAAQRKRPATRYGVAPCLAPRAACHAFGSAEPHIAGHRFTQPACDAAGADATRRRDSLITPRRSPPPCRGLPQQPTVLLEPWASSDEA